MFPPVGAPLPIPLGPPRGMNPPRSPPRPIPPRPIIPTVTKTGRLVYLFLIRCAIKPKMQHHLYKYDCEADFIKCPRLSDSPLPIMPPRSPLISMPPLIIMGFRRAIETFSFLPWKSLPEQKKRTLLHSTSCNQHINKRF